MARRPTSARRWKANGRRSGRILPYLLRGAMVCVLACVNRCVIIFNLVNPYKRHACVLRGSGGGRLTLSLSASYTLCYLMCVWRWFIEMDIIEGRSTDSRAHRLKCVAVRAPAIVYRAHLQRLGFDYATNLSVSRVDGGARGRLWRRLRGTGFLGGRCYSSVEVIGKMYWCTHKRISCSAVCVRVLHGH